MNFSAASHWPGFVRLWVVAASTLVTTVVQADVETSYNETVSIFDFRPPFTDENGLIEGQTVNFALLETLDNIGDPSRVQQIVLNCRVPAETCTGPEGIVSLSSTSSRLGFEELRLGTAGSDAVSAQMLVDGVGTVSNPESRVHLTMNSVSTGDWQLLEVSAPFGAGLPPTVDVDMTYTQIAAVSRSTNTPDIDFVHSTLSTILIYDLASYSPDGTGTATIFRPFYQRVSVTNAVGSEEIIDQVVTLQLVPDTPYLMSLRADTLSTTIVPAFATNVDVSSVDHSASAFADPVFTVNPDWAAANSEIAEQIVINRVLNSIPIDVDIRPFLPSEYNFVSVRSRGLIAVAILASDDLDAADVDVESLRFGVLRAAPRTMPRPRLIDLNWDGKPDLLVHFRTSDTGIGCGDTEARLVGMTNAGTYIAGTDVVLPVPCP